MRKMFILCSLCPGLFWGNVNSSDINEEESLFINRIVDFWEEEQFRIAEQQMQEFLRLYPRSSYCPFLYSALGDLKLNNKDFSQALAYFEKIEDVDLAKKTFLHRLQCLYNLEQFEKIVELCQQKIQSEESSQEDPQIKYFQATALYHLLLKAQGENEKVFASKAIALFEELMLTDFKAEISQALADCYCKVQQYEKASSLFQELAEEESSFEMLFQAAFIEAQVNKEKALTMFQSIASSHENLETQKNTLQKEALFNTLVLSFELQKYDSIIEQKDQFLEGCPSDKADLIHLFLARSLFEMQNIEEGLNELQTFIALQSGPSASLKSAFLTLVDFSIQNKNIYLLNQTLLHFETFFASDDDIENARLARCSLLRDSGLKEEAFQLLQNSLSTKALGERKLLEIISLCSELEKVLDGIKYCQNLLQEYPSSEKLELVEENLITFLHKGLSLENPDLSSYTNNLKHYASHGSSEKIQHLAKYYLAKEYVQNHDYVSALEILETFESDLFASHIHLLKAICYRDGIKNIDLFIEHANKALQNPCENSLGAIHAALYNAYLEKNELDLAQTHLKEAFYAHSDIDINSLIWLCNRFNEQKQFHESIVILKQLQDQQNNSPLIGLQLAAAYQSINDLENAKIQLTQVLALDEKNEQAKLNLAQVLALQNHLKEANDLYQSIWKDHLTLKKWSTVKACLEGARTYKNMFPIECIDKASDEHLKLTVQLKNLILQKNWNFEPLHMEAALEYLDLHDLCYKNEPEHRLKLLQRLKLDFSSEDDLLAKDYHLARQKDEKKGLIYSQFIAYIDAQISQTESLLENNEELQKLLQEKSKDLLLQVVENNIHPQLTARAERCLNP